MNFIGIDPGKQGAIARIAPDQSVYTFTTQNATPQELAVVVQMLLREGPCLALIEKVGAMPTDARRAAFVFGENYGIWQGLTAGMRMPLDYVKPREWQRIFVPVRGKKTRTAHKATLRHRAQALFPGVKITNGNCDAILIAEFCRRTKSPQLSPSLPTS